MTESVGNFFLCQEKYERNVRLVIHVEQGLTKTILVKLTLSTGAQLSQREAEKSSFSEEKQEVERNTLYGVLLKPEEKEIAPASTGGEVAFIVQLLSFLILTFFIPFVQFSIFNFHLSKAPLLY